MHVLTADVMNEIERWLGLSETRMPTLSDALADLPTRGRYLAYRLRGTRFNLGVKYGLLKAQLGIALSGRDRDQILTEMIDLLAHRVESQ
jgi:UTP--glucose-1-phosphate uridylyltransferase